MSSSLFAPPRFSDLAAAAAGVPSARPRSSSHASGKALHEAFLSELKAGGHLEDGVRLRKGRGVYSFWYRIFLIFPLKNDFEGALYLFNASLQSL